MFTLIARFVRHFKQAHRFHSFEVNHTGLGHITHLKGKFKTNIHQIRVEIQETTGPFMTSDYRVGK